MNKALEFLSVEQEPLVDGYCSRQDCLDQGRCLGSCSSGPGIASIVGQVVETSVEDPSLADCPLAAIGCVCIGVIEQVTSQQPQY